MIGIAPAVMLVLDAPPTHSAAWGNIWERISASEAIMLAVVTAIGGAYKIRADRRAEREADKAAILERKAAAVDKAAQDLREWLTTRVAILEAKVEEMQRERELHMRVASTFFDVLADYPDPPGAPPIPATVASVIGWPPQRAQPAPAPSPEQT